MGVGMLVCEFEVSHAAVVCGGHLDEAGLVRNPDSQFPHDAWAVLSQFRFGRLSNVLPCPLFEILDRYY